MSAVERAPQVTKKSGLRGTHSQSRSDHTDRYEVSLADMPNIACRSGNARAAKSRQESPKLVKTRINQCKDERLTAGLQQRKSSVGCRRPTRCAGRSFVAPQSGFSNIKLCERRESTGSVALAGPWRGSGSARNPAKGGANHRRIAPPIRSRPSAAGAAESTPYNRPHR